MNPRIIGLLFIVGALICIGGAVLHDVSFSPRSSQPVIQSLPLASDEQPSTVTHPGAAIPEPLLTSKSIDEQEIAFRERLNELNLLVHKPEFAEYRQAGESLIRDSAAIQKRSQEGLRTCLQEHPGGFTRWQCLGPDAEHIEAQFGVDYVSALKQVVQQPASFYLKMGDDRERDLNENLVPSQHRLMSEFAAFPNASEKFGITSQELSAQFNHAELLMAQSEKAEARELPALRDLLLVDASILLQDQHWRLSKFQSALYKREHPSNN